MRDAFFLFELYAVGVRSDVNVEKIRYWAFVFHVPALRECVDELIVKGADALVRVEGKEVVHVAAQDQLVTCTGDNASHGEHTGV
eukprot:2503501-Pleurochrysis_carterae.AAC.1